MNNAKLILHFMLLVPGSGFKKTPLHLCVIDDFLKNKKNVNVICLWMVRTSFNSSIAT